MSFIEAAIFLLLLAAISAPIASRFHLPLEIFLVGASAAISLLPWLPGVQINPDIILKLFLPPILFSAAYFTSWRDFKFNLRPISLLAFGLVMLTAFLVAIVAKTIIPNFTWGEGFLLGAIVSPTDATSAVAIIKKLGASQRLVTVLEGESLLNDATALLLFRFSLVAIMTGTFSMTHAIVQFFLITVGGAVLGLALGIISIFLVQKIKNVQAEITFTFITAFTSYLVAEHLGFSGVIATVICGIYAGMRFPEYASSSTRMSAKASWKTLLFIINGFVFTLIGLELPWVSKNLSPNVLWDLIFYSTAIILTIIIVRVIWIFCIAYFSRMLFPAIARKDPMPSWQLLFTLGWAGMRGIVSLAAALAIPILMPSGSPFPHRDLLILITYSVVVATLLLPSFTLPFLINIFKLTEDVGAKMQEEVSARIQALQNALEEISQFEEKEKIHKEVLYEFQKEINRKLKIIRTQLGEFPYSTLNEEYSTLKFLTMAAIESERKTLLKLRKTGEINDEIFHLLSDELDLEELRAKSLRI